MNQNNKKCQICHTSNIYSRYYYCCDIQQNLCKECKCPKCKIHTLKIQKYSQNSSSIYENNFLCYGCIKRNQNDRKYIHKGCKKQYCPYCMRQNYLIYFDQIKFIAKDCAKIQIPIQIPECHCYVASQQIQNYLSTFCFVCNQIMKNKQILLKNKIQVHRNCYNSICSRKYLTKKQKQLQRFLLQKSYRCHSCDQAIFSQKSITNCKNIEQTYICQKCYQQTMYIQINLQKQINSKHKQQKNIKVEASIKQKRQMQNIQQARKVEKQINIENRPKQSKINIVEEKQPKNIEQHLKLLNIQQKQCEIAEAIAQNEQSIVNNKQIIILQTIDQLCQCVQCLLYLKTQEVHEINDNKQNSINMKEYVISINKFKQLNKKIEDIYKKIIKASIPLALNPPIKFNQDKSMVYLLSNQQHIKNSYYPEKQLNQKKKLDELKIDKISLLSNNYLKKQETKINQKQIKICFSCKKQFNKYQIESKLCLNCTKDKTYTSIHYDKSILSLRKSRFDIYNSNRFQNTK